MSRKPAGAPGKHEMEPERRLIYDGLKRICRSGGVPTLSPILHRYVAIVNNLPRGTFSNFKLACSTVDTSARYTGNLGLWESRPRNLERNYVLDTKTGQTYMRVRDLGPARHEEEPVDGVLEAA